MSLCAVHGLGTGTSPICRHVWDDGVGPTCGSWGSSNRATAVAIEAGSAVPAEKVTFYLDLEEERGDKCKCVRPLVTAVFLLLCLEHIREKAHLLRDPVSERSCRKEPRQTRSTATPDRRTRPRAVKPRAANSRHHVCRRVRHRGSSCITSTFPIPCEPSRFASVSIRAEIFRRSSS